MKPNTSFDAFWSLWLAESVIELQFDSCFGFPIRVRIAEEL